MIDVSVLNQSIRHYISQVTGLDIDTAVRKADQDAPTGSVPFASVKIILVSKIGHDEINHIDQSTPSIDINENRSGNREFTASINFFNSNALNNAYKMQGSVYENANHDFLISKSIGFVRSSDVRDLTEIDLARYEERGQLDMFFNAIDNNTNTVSSIQSQEIDGTFEVDGKTYNNIIEVTQ